MTQKLPTEKSDTPPTPCPWNLFYAKNFLKHRRVRLRIFLVLWDKKLSTENRDITFLSIKFFDTRKEWDSKRFPYEIVWHLDKNFSTEKCVTPSPHLSSIKFLDTTLWKTEKLLYEAFRQCETKKLTKTWYSYYPKKIDSITFLKYKGAPRKFFGTVRHEIFQRKNVIPHPPPDPKFFSIPKNFWNIEGFPYEVFQSCETKKFRQKIMIPLCKKFFRYPKFSNTPNCSNNFFSVLWDNNFLIQSRDIPLLGIKFFDTRNILKHRRAPLRKFLAVWDKK